MDLKTEFGRALNPLISTLVSFSPLWGNPFPHTSLPFSLHLLFLRCDDGTYFVTMLCCVLVLVQ